MKLYTGIVLVGLILSGAAYSQEVRVRGYTKADGTYVAPSVRTAPNDTRTDNWSSKPNVNPYTGQAGTQDPYAPKPASKPKPY